MDTFRQEVSPGEIVDAKPVIVEKPEKLSDPTKAKSGPPDMNEWQDFFGRFVVKLIVDGYLWFVMGDDIMSELSDYEKQQIFLSEEDMKEIASPLAEVANKSAFMRKHGRSMVAFADSYESVFKLLFWGRRVQRIAKKHRKPQQQRQRRQQPQQTAPQFSSQEGTQNVPDGSSQAANGQPRPVGVFNPGSGG